MSKNRPNIQYFHFVSENRGNRYFRVDWINNRCVQVVVDSGEKKGGRPHMMGVYKLALPSFQGTYYWYLGRKDAIGSKLLITTEAQFDKAWQSVLRKLLR